jgi:hypothetical protein
MADSDSEFDKMAYEKMQYELEDLPAEDTFEGNGSLIDTAYNLEAKLIIRALGEELVKNASIAVAKMLEIINMDRRNIPMHELGADLKRIYNDTTNIHSHILTYGKYVNAFNQYENTALDKNDYDEMLINKIVDKITHEHSLIPPIKIAEKLYHLINSVAYQLERLHGAAFEAHEICAFINDFKASETYNLIKEIAENRYIPPVTGNRTKPAKSRVCYD